MSRQKDKIYVVGHKNPDTDSICSAIAYAALKTKLTGHAYEPRRAGQLNEETQYVLEKFAVKPPKLLSDLREQIKDVELKEVEGLTSNSYPHSVGNDAGAEHSYTSGCKRRQFGRGYYDR